MGICCSKASPDVEMDVPHPKEPRAIPGVAQPSPAGASTRQSSRKQSITETLMMEHGKGKGHRRLHEVYDTSDAVILGEGMSGRVATCRQRYTGELFALKTLSVAKLKVDMDELRQEIDILKRLDHPNIVKVYETFEEEGLFHVVMELCCGGQLISRLKSHKRGFGEEMAARLMSKMIASILYCHERNVCHRDVKLDNFVYEGDDEDAELKLIDFGLSHVLLHTQEKMHDRVGTLTYMAPEVLTGRGEGGLQGYTSACDMWSLGVVAYMLLSGRRPFHHSDREEKRRLVKEGKASFEHEAWSNVSAAAQDFVRSLLHRDPRSRATAKHALDDPWIKQMCASHATATTPAEEMQRNSLVLHSLQDFMHAEAMHKVALEVVAFTAPPASFDELRKLFKAIDTDNSGTISYEELKTAMENYPEIPEVQVRRLFEAVDMNNKGEVEYNSFLAATCSAQQVIGEPTLRTAFSVLDRDSDGIITKEDLMETVGQACSEEEIDQMLAQLDLDATRIFYADFQHMMTNSSRYGQIGRHLRPQRRNKKALTMGSINLEGINQEPDSRGGRRSPPTRVPPRREASEPSRLAAEPPAEPPDSSTSVSQGSLRRSG